MLNLLSFSVFRSDQYRAEPGGGDETVAEPGCDSLPLPLTLEAHSGYRLSLILEPPASSLAELRQIQRKIARGIASRLSPYCLPGGSYGDTNDNSSRITVSSGAGALLSDSTIEKVTALLSPDDPFDIRLPLEDFAWVGSVEIPRCSATCFAVESAADMLVLMLHPHCPPELRNSLSCLSRPLDSLRRAMRFLCDRDAEVAIMGSIRPHCWKYLEDEVACRVRVYADGCSSQGGLVPAILSQAGDAEVYAWFAEIGQALFLDSRRFFAGASMPSEDDFFWSDLCEPDRVSDPALRRLTGLAGNAPFPCVLGGHSTINGGLLALVETAWMTGPDVDRGYHISW